MSSRSMTCELYPVGSREYISLRHWHSVVLKALPDGWELGLAGRESMEMGLEVRAILVEPTMRWETRMSVGLDGPDPVSYLIRAALEYVDQCMATTIPTHPQDEVVACRMCGADYRAGEPHRGCILRGVVRSGGGDGEVRLGTHTTTGTGRKVDP